MRKLTSVIQESLYGRADRVCDNSSVGNINLPNGDYNAIMSGNMIQIYITENNVTEPIMMHRHIRGENIRIPVKVFNNKVFIV